MGDLCKRFFLEDLPKLKTFSLPLFSDMIKLNIFGCHLPLFSDMIKLNYFQLPFKILHGYGEIRVIS